MKSRQLFLAFFLLMISVSASAFRVDTVAVSGLGLAEPMKALVVVPDGAEASAPVPTVYLLHGYGGNYLNWIEKQPRICELADQYGMIVVTPDGKNSWYWDAPGNPDQQVETFFVESLVPYIDANYPTIRDRSKRAIAGLSMGGHGALFLAARHPDIFGAASAISGGVDIRPFPGNWKIREILGPKEDNEELWNSMTVAGIVPAIKEADLAIVIDCGASDFFADVNRNLHQTFLDMEIPHDYYCRPGNHSWNYWNNAVLFNLLYFNEFFNK